MPLFFSLAKFLILIFIVTLRGTTLAKIEELCPTPINSPDKPNAEEKHCECVTESSQKWGEQRLVIDCNEMEIDHLNASVENLPEHTVQLDLSYNRLKKLPFFNGADLRVLDASSNLIETIEDANFAGLPKLVKLDLSRNRIKAIGVNAFEGLQYVTELNLAHNQIASLAANVFLWLPSLVQLTLSHNPGLGPVFADEVGVDLYRHLGVTPNLLTLYAENCGLTGIDIQRGVGLRNLYLSENNLTALTEMPHNVNILDLSMNPIETLEPGFIPPFTKVKMLLLQDMPLLKSVASLCLANLPELNHLSFRGSMNLEEVSGDAFGSDTKYSKMEIFNLQGAKLKTLNESLYPALKSLQAFDLAGNPLECNCDIAWVNSLYIETNAECAEPSHLKGVLLSGVPDKKLQCRLFPRWVYRTINSFLILLVLIVCSAALAVIILKLRKVNRSNRHKTTIGQTSPYAPVMTQPVRPDSAYA